MSCANDCANEARQQDEISPGPVGDREIICRGAYGKTMHYNASGKVRPSFVKNNDLLAGSLSVWRRWDGSEEEFHRIRGILSQVAPQGAVLFDVFGAQTASVRGIRSTGSRETQVLHVYDDCRTDVIGGKDPNHAVIAICSECEPKSLTKDSPLYIEIRDELVILLKRNVCWSLSSELRA